MYGVRNAKWINSISEKIYNVDIHEIEFIEHESFTTDPEIVHIHLYPEKGIDNSTGTAAVVVVLNDPLNVVWADVSRFSCHQHECEILIRRNSRTLVKKIIEVEHLQIVLLGERAQFKPPPYATSTLISKYKFQD